MHLKKAQNKGIWGTEKDIFRTREDKERKIRSFQFLRDEQ